MKESPVLYDVQRSSSERVMSRALKLLHLSGVWPTANGRASSLRRILLLSCNPLFMLIGISYLLVAEEASLAAVENTCIFLTSTPVSFSLLLLAFRREKFEEVVSNLKSFAGRTICKSTEETLQGALADEKKVGVLFTVVFATGIFSNLFEPLFSYFEAYRNPNDTFTMELPTKMYPMGEENVYVFLGLYAFQFVLTIFVFITALAEEIFLFSLIMSTTTQFEILIKLIKNADCNKNNLFNEIGDGHLHRASQTGRKDSGSRVNVVEYFPGFIGGRYEMSTTQNNENPKADKIEENVNFWRKFAAFHQEALANARDVGNLLRTTLFLHYASTSLIICLLLYQINSLQSEEIFKIFYTCFFLIAVSIRLFIFNLLPTRLTIKSEAVAKAVADTQWYNYSNETKSTLVIILCSAQRPVYLWAGKFAVMSLETYAAIMQAGFSYYNILRSLS